MDRIEYYIARTLFELFRRIPFSIVKYIGQFIAFVTQYIIRYRCDIILDNLKRAFPDYSEKTLLKIRKDVYLNFSFLWVEWLQSWRFDKSFSEKNCSTENWDVVENAVKQNKGVVIFSGHIGNFEWMARYVQHYFGQVTGIMRRMHNKLINDFSVEYRKNLGFGVIYTDGAFVKSVELLNNKGIIGVAGDQDAHEKGVFVDFFGIPSSTPAGAALFHLRAGAPVIFGASVREKWGKFKFIFEEIPPPPSLEENDDNIYFITQALTSLLEKYTRKYPGQYFWTHKRWKTVPSESQSKIYEERKERLMDRSLLT